MKKLTCLRCGAKMQLMGQKKIQLGEAGLVTGILPNLAAGALDTEIYVCPTCGKMEFYWVQETQPPVEDALPQVRCPICGRQHDFDYPKCPFCGHRYR